MAQPNLGILRTVADQLDRLGLSYAFVGGSIVNLLLDDPTLSPARPTDDVDVILEVLTSEKYSSVETRLRDLGFSHDMTPGAPLCRWLLNGVTVDIMPTEGAALGLNTDLFREALETAVEQTFAHTRLKLISPVAFVAIKHAAFLDRGNSDFYASHDLEDIITVIDGRANFVSELEQSHPQFRTTVIKAISYLMKATAFVEALAGHLPSDQASQQRLPLLRGKLREISKLTS